MGIVLIGLSKSKQLLKYLLILRRPVMFLPHTQANSGPLVGILEFENQIFVSGSCTSHGALIDKISVRVLFDMGATKSCMSKSFYMANTSLHTLS